MAGMNGPANSENRDIGSVLPDDILTVLTRRSLVKRLIYKSERPDSGRMDVERPIDERGKCPVSRHTEYQASINPPMRHSV